MAIHLCFLMTTVIGSLITVEILEKNKMKKKGQQGV